MLSRKVEVAMSAELGGDDPVEGAVEVGQKSSPDSLSPNELIVRLVSRRTVIALVPFAFIVQMRPLQKSPYT